MEPVYWPYKAKSSNIQAKAIAPGRKSGHGCPAASPLDASLALRPLADQLNRPVGVIVHDRRGGFAVSGQHRLMHSAVIGQVTLDIGVNVNELCQVTIPVRHAQSFERRRDELVASQTVHRPVVSIEAQQEGDGREGKRLA